MISLHDYQILINRIADLRNKAISLKSEGGAQNFDMAVNELVSHWKVLREYLGYRPGRGRKRPAIDPVAIDKELKQGGITKKAIAKRIGVSRVTLNKLLKSVPE